jgi:hypothetical protein
MNKKITIGIVAIILLAVSPIAFSYGCKLAIHLRHRMQEHFAEIHAMIAGDEGDQPFGDNALTSDQIAARDNVVTPIATSTGMIAWEVLAKAQTKVDESNGQNIIKPVFTPEIKKLDQKTLIAKGYMFPLDAFGKQTHFLLGPYPPSCPFCLPAGPNELIEVKPDEPMKFTYDPVTVKGKFELLQSDDDIKQGMFYRMENASLQE